MAIKDRLRKAVEDKATTDEESYIPVYQTVEPTGPDVMAEFENTADIDVDSRPATIHAPAGKLTVTKGSKVKYVSENDIDFWIEDGWTMV